MADFTGTLFYGISLNEEEVNKTFFPEGTEKPLGFDDLLEYLDERFEKKVISWDYHQRTELFHFGYFLASSYCGEIETVDMKKFEQKKEKINQELKKIFKSKKKDISLFLYSDNEY